MIRLFSKSKPLQDDLSIVDIPVGMDCRDPDAYAPWEESTRPVEGVLVNGKRVTESEYRDVLKSVKPFTVESWL